ncbi:heterokaryon incompatibility protein-domain-containing protein [Tricladium varicosporioides]|nr:heterokaryon incompatibility protein-domain-containing protein [Hymenoscyphus varicosporioides]
MSVNGDRSNRSSVNSIDVRLDAEVEKKLCQICQSLRLGVHRFKVQPPSSEHSGNPSTDRPLHSSATSLRLGNLLDIRNRSSTCPLCELIVESADELRGAKLPDRIANEAAEKQLQQAVCSIIWEIDGRETASSRASGHNPRNLVRGLTRRMHIRWNHTRLPDAYLVYIAPESYSMTTSDADRVWDKNSLFLGRKVKKRIDNQALITSWLDLCKTSHQGPCRQSDRVNCNKFYNMISRSYFGVIDVRDMQLMQLPYSDIGHSYDDSTGRHTVDSVTHEPYVALSYVWGTEDNAYKTEIQNVMLHRMHGGLEKVLQRLPKAIHDAIDLVRRLGFRYLWVDRLCIVQDSSRSWKLNAYNMDLIYGNAILTICAADGEASAGLRAIRSESHNIQQLRRTVAPGLDLMITRPPEMYIRESKWNERAWTFQERLLSRRCLIFANGRVYFQCRSTVMSEDIYADRKGAGWSLDLVDAPLQMFRQLNNRAFQVYMKCVELYTQRKLTQQKDILAAFSGMSNLMEERMCSPFVHGLPSSHFDLALLWEPIKTVERRVITDSGDEKNLSIPDFPSWSWAGWNGTVMYKDSIVGGILDNVSDWLNRRTWIKWWVRDGYGDLRPLWDDMQSGIDMSEDAKWRGYSRKKVDRQTRHSSSWTIPRENERYKPEQTYHVAGSVSERESYSDDEASDKNSEHSRPEKNSNHSYNDSDWSQEQEPVEIDARRTERDILVRGTKQARFRSNPVSPTVLRPGESSHRRSNSYSGYNSSPARPTQPPSPWNPGQQPPAPRHPSQTYSPRIYNNTHQVHSSRVYNNISRIPRSSGIQNTGYQSPPLSNEIDVGVTRVSRVSTRDRRDPTNYDTERRGSPPPERRHYIQSENPTHNSHFYDMFFDGDDQEFRITLKDYPYRVVKSPFIPQVDNLEFPLLPILQFRTWHTWLHIKTASASTEHNESRKRVSMEVGAGQVRCHIADEAGDWCGSIVLDTRWQAGSSSRQEFIAISEAKDFTRAECHDWTYYIPKERDQSEWDLFYVLLIERKDERWERVGVGKVFKEAFRDARFKEIMLG